MHPPCIPCDGSDGVSAPEPSDARAVASVPADASTAATQPSPPDPATERAALRGVVTRSLADVRQAAARVRELSRALPQRTRAERERRASVLLHVDHALAYGHAYSLGLALDALRLAERTQDPAEAQQGSEPRTEGA